MNSNNTSNGSQTQPMVPLLVPGTKKKVTSKKPRVRPRKKNPLVGAKRKANKIGAVGSSSSSSSSSNIAAVVSSGGNKTPRISANNDVAAMNMDRGRSQNSNGQNQHMNTNQRRTNSGKTSSSTSISIGSTIQKRNERQLVTQSQSSQPTSASSSSSTSLTNNNTNESSENAGSTSTTAASSTSTYIQNYTIDQSDVIPYQHLGQLDPSWNIPQPQGNEKPMKEFCSKYKVPKEAKKRGESNEVGNNVNGSDNGGSGTTTFTNANGTNAGVTTNNEITNSQTQEPTEPQSDQRSGPLVEVINGEIVIKESTMIVGRRQTTEEVDRELNNAVVEEDNNTLTVTYRSFTSREKSIRWTVEETRKFYLALRQCGTDFTTMANFFDGSDGKRKRSRKQLKNKYNIECRKNLKLIDMAMNPKAQLKLDLSIFGELEMENLNNDKNNDTPSTMPTTTTTPTGSENVDNSIDQSTNEEKEKDNDDTVDNTSTTLPATSMASSGTPPPPPLNTVTPGTLDTLATPDVEETDPSSAINIRIPIVNDDEPQKLDEDINNQERSSGTAVVSQDPKEQEEEENEPAIDTAAEKGEEKADKFFLPIVLPGAGKKKKKPKFRAKPKPRPKKKN